MSGISLHNQAARVQLWIVLAKRVMFLAGYPPIRALRDEVSELRFKYGAHPVGRWLADQCQDLHVVCARLQELLEDE